MQKIRFIWKLVFIFCLFLIGKNDLQAQYEYQDFTFSKESIKNRKIVPYPFTNERDVMYCRRIWRVIDTREKMNLIMKWPRNPLYRIIYEAVTKGYGSAPITAYTSDSLTSVMTAEEVLKLGVTTTATQIIDPNDPDGERLIDTIIRNEFVPKDGIRRYMIMEDWIFDKQTSQFFIRIIAIAPLYNIIESGMDLGEFPMYWIRWTDFRPIMVNQEIFNRQNDAMRLSYDDFFDLRMFSSYIVKESNAYDFEIDEFDEFKTDKFAALLESEKIKTKLFEFEHDLWEY
jgi:gliding motility associated protien GldN